MRHGPGTRTRIVIAAAIAVAAIAVGVASVWGRSSQPSDEGMAYVIYRPAGLSRSSPAPLVILMTGVGASAFIASTRLNEQADRNGFVVAYLSFARSYNDRSREEQGRGEPYPDIAFVDRTIDEVRKAENIDPFRVYITGFSAGGVLAYRAACVLAGKLTAAAPVGASLVLPGCTPARPLSMFVIYGTADPTLTAGGVQQDVAHFRQVNRCPATAVTTTSGAATVQTWSPCGAGTSVALAAISGQDHGWPQSPRFDATGSMWKFFSTQRAGGGAAATGGKLLGVRVLSGSPGRRIRARIQAAEDLSVRLRLMKGKQALAARTYRVKPVASRALLLRVPPSTPAGAYKLEIVLRSVAGGAARTIVRPLALPRR